MGHTQKAIAHILSEEIDIPDEKGMRFLQRVIDIIAEDIIYTGRIELRGLGTFTVTKRGPMHITHPGTGSSVYVPEKKIVQFRTSSLIKKRLNPKGKITKKKTVKKKRH